MLREQIKQKTEEIDTIIRKFLPEDHGMQKHVIEAMNYSVMAGGKRLRPMLMQETFRMFGGTSAIVEPFMAAIEMIHNYSLIHDDLPALDNDDYRRGKETTHKKFGESMAILAGDGLLNLAYETAATAFLLEPDNRGVAKAFALLAQKAGIFGMVGGQAVDVENDGQPLDRDQLDFIYAMKTGALLEASMGIGAVLAGADSAQLEQVLSAASDLGLAFQIRDDILDVYGDFSVIGKPVGSDAKNHKTTYVTLYGPEKAARDVEELSARAVRVMRALPGENPFLIDLMEYLVRREK